MKLILNNNPDREIVFSTDMFKDVYFKSLENEGIL